MRAASIVGCGLPTSDDAVGGMWGGRDVSGEVGVRDAHAPAPESAILFPQTLAAMQTAPDATFTPVPPPPDEPIPAAPAGEPARDTGPPNRHPPLVPLRGSTTG